MPALRVLQLNLPQYPGVPDIANQTQGAQTLNTYFKNLTLQLGPWSSSVMNAVNGGLLPINAVSASFAVGASATGVVVTMSPVITTGIGYVVLMQPTWNAGGYWVTPSNNASFTLLWANPTPVTTTFGLVIAMDALPAQ